MKDNLDELIRNAYHQGEVPGDALNQTVIQKVKEQEAMKKNNILSHEKWRNSRRGSMRKIATAAAVAAAVLLLGTGVAHATMQYFGIDYFSKRFGSSGLNEEAKELVENEPVVTIKESENSKDILDYKVSEVLCDNKYVIVNIDVTVKDAKKFFLVPGADDPDTPVSNLDIGIKSKQSIAEYCKENGMQLVNIHFPYDSKTEKNVEYMSYDNKLSGTGKASIMICSKRLTTDQKFVMNIKPWVGIYEGAEKILGYDDDVLQIQVEDNSSVESACYTVNGAKEYKVPETSMTLKEVKITTTEVGSYLNVIYESTASSDDAGSEFIDLCDENGELISSSIVAVGYSQPVGDNVYALEGCYENIGLPDEIYLSIGEGVQVIALEKSAD